MHLLNPFLLNIPLLQTDFEEVSFYNLAQAIHSLREKILSLSRETLDNFSLYLENKIRHPNDLGYDWHGVEKGHH